MFVSQSLIVPPTAPVGAGATWTSAVINTQGLTKGSVGLQSTQAGTLTVQRYVDAGGLIAIGAAITDSTSPFALDWVDGIPIGSIVVSFLNSAGTAATLSNITVNLGP